ncbi:hypothetical protein JVU11DRAFT_5493 [Chiua virens]|nr:hypothetical protein JVU11DRAFT_5493 [Chiua virens]
MGSSTSDNPQTCQTLLSSLIAPNFAQDGLNASTAESGEAASLTSTNNFINWCATINLPITNGQQLPNGSCNPTPMGAIPSASNMPSVKFVAPTNLAVIPVEHHISNYISCQELCDGLVRQPIQKLGHSHIIIEALESLNQTTPTDPTQFAFYLGLDDKADAKGYLYANVTSGLPEGTYKMSTIMTAANHQPLALPVIKRGVSEDTIYFTVVT